MIAKHVAMKSVKKSDFAGLVKYMTDEQKMSERVGLVLVTNCHSDRPDAATLEIINTQEKNTRAESDKTFHLVVSFPVGEQPDEEVLKAIETKLCDGLGYGEHQRVSVVHHDTDNLHIHIAVNKIHPTHYTLHDPYYSHKVLGKLCEKLELEYGLTQVNHQPLKIGSENCANDMEYHAGVESLLGWIMRECLEQIQTATSWADLHRVLQENGLALKERGNGLVITAQDGLTVKASSVAREMSKAKLENKFGAFEPSTDRTENTGSPKQKYEARPVRSRIDTTLLFAQYKMEQQGMGTKRTKEWAFAREHKNRLIEEAKRSAKLKRAVTKLMGQSRDEKKLLYAMTSKAMHNEIERIKTQYREARANIFKKYQPQQWADWLQRRATAGDQEALAALRARQLSQGLIGNAVGAIDGQRVKPRFNVIQDNITKKGTIIYRVGASAIRDDGDTLKVSKDATKDGLEAALRMAMERYGNKITVTGSIDFKAKIIQAAVAAKLPITFADATLERHRQVLLSKNNLTESNHESAQQRRYGTGSGVSVAGPIAGIHNDRKPVGFTGKPNLGRIGCHPPPESRNRLRNLSDVAVVRLASGTEVLLPGHVSDHLEQQGTQPDNLLRRPLFGASVAPEGRAAANKYIEELNKKRVLLSNILKHRPYSHRDVGEAIFSGLRKVEGQTLALLKRSDEIVVVPIDETTVRKLNKLSLDDPVTLIQQGAIKTTKGRRR
jgi:hypothetical protein